MKAREKVKVAAGEFDAFRIECADNWTSGPAQGTGNTTCWYSPAVKGILKTEHKQDYKWNQELVKYKTE